MRRRRSREISVRNQNPTVSLPLEGKVAGSSACGTVFLWDFVLLTEIFRQRRSLPVFLSQFPAPADGRRGDSRIARLPDFVFTTEIL